jgi:hypothetical protein
MNAATTTHRLTLPGPMLRRGFWLYVWRVTAPDDREFLYVGRTGDNSSPYAANPYRRMGQHLGDQPNQSALRNHFAAGPAKTGLDLEACTFDFVCNGPLYAEPLKADGATREDLMKAHRTPRDIVGAMEKALAEDLAAAGYAVLNTVRCKWPLDPILWAPVRSAFAQHFPRLNNEAAA